MNAVGTIKFPGTALIISGAPGGNLSISTIRPPQKFDSCACPDVHILRRLTITESENTFLFGRVNILVTSYTPVVPVPVVVVPVVEPVPVVPVPVVPVPVDPACGTI